MASPATTPTYSQASTALSRSSVSSSTPFSAPNAVGYRLAFHRRYSAAEIFLLITVGRRKMVLVGATINIFCVTWVAIYLGVLTGNRAGGWVSVAALCIFAVGYGIGWAPNGFGLPAETMPNRFRAKVRCSPPLPLSLSPPSSRAFHDIPPILGSVQLPLSALGTPYSKLTLPRRSGHFALHRPTIPHQLPPRSFFP